MTIRPLAVVASTLTNACGVGLQSVRSTLRSGVSALRGFDIDWSPPLATWIGRVDGLESLPLPDAFRAVDTRSSRLANLCLEQDGFAGAVAAAAARHGRDRVGVFVGTTTSGMLTTELAYRRWAMSSTDIAARPALAIDANVNNMHATTAFVRQRLGLTGTVQTISTACSSSAKVFAAASRFIAAGLCDAAVVGGVESLALSTLFGFKALELISQRPCRPFDAERDGISIGEAAGFALLEADADAAVRFIGYGESSDAWHMSSPHPEGAGAAVAMRAALASAGIDAAGVDYVNLHGTASRANDAAEDCAIADVFGGRTPVSSTKGFTGHALGAAGITEALITVMALRDQWMPGTVGCRIVDASLRSAIVRESRPHSMCAAMSNSFGFGGSNCALMFGLA